MVPPNRSHNIPIIRVFIASSSELADERQRVVEVLKDLVVEDTNLVGRVILVPVRWDHCDAPVAMRATETPQDSVNDQIGRPSDCDIVIGLLWSKLGMPIESDAYRKATGGSFTGTEWELEDAARRFKESGRRSPDIYLFKCTREPAVIRQHGENFQQAGERTDAQQALVRAFLDDWRKRYGSQPTEFESPVEFEENLRGMLRTRVIKILGDRQRQTLPTDTEQVGQTLKASEWEGTPYRGLETFQFGHAPIFFGRTREIQQLLDKLADPAVRLLLVAGASGTGKSSLVLAGVAPRLAQGALPGSDEWRHIQFTPAALTNSSGRPDPLASMAHALKPHLDFAGPVASLAERLEGDKDTIKATLNKTTGDRAEGASWLILIDQFEELFTWVDGGPREAFVQCLDHLTTLQHVRLVATMRSEFLHVFTLDATLNRVINDRGDIFSVSSPSKSALYDIVTKPAEMAGLGLPHALAIRVLDDAGLESQQEGDEAPGVLPLVEYTLEQLYRRAGQAGEASLEAYDAIGGIAGAIQRCAEDAIGEMDEDTWEQQLGPLFRHLVDVNDAGLATRRRASLGVFSDSAGVGALLKKLCDAGLLVTREAVVEVAHEALFTAWVPLQHWIDKRKVAPREWRNMEFAAAEWDRRGRHLYLAWPHERQQAFEKDTAELGRTPSTTEQAFLKSEIDRLLEELEVLDASHDRRADIGKRLSLLDDPRPGLGFRDDGTPDMSLEEYWCAVRAGTVTLEKDAGTLEVGQCYIARYPITRAQFRAFQVAEDGYQNPDRWTDLHRAELPMQPEEGGNRPATGVSWYDAIAFCRWLSARLGYQISLPTEWQWQQAATGGDPQREYPWPGIWDGRKANTRESALSRTTAVGMYPGGAALNGPLDMAGNVWEWCLNKYLPADHQTIDKSNDRRVLRGGSWDFFQAVAHCAYRYYFTPRYRFVNLGFRVCCSSPIFDH